MIVAINVTREISRKPVNNYLTIAANARIYNL